jgi:predicted nuclease of predicted toxin-antitoxin system
MRFLADENVPRVVIERLRAEGHDIISVAEMQPSISDDEVLNVAEADGRILITGDRDFGEMVVRQRLKLRGVLLLELDRLPNAMRADTVAQLVSAHAERLAGNLVVVEPGRVRVRPLPG